MYYDNELVKIDINENLRIYDDIHLKLWGKNYQDFNLYVFNLYVDEKELENSWEKLRNDIAFHFQSNIDIDIELWNIYIIFFLEKKIEKKDLKYKIENDHYCARKIVLDNVGDIKDNEEKIKNEINKKLFDLEILSLSSSNNIYELEIEINKIDSRLTNLEKINSLLVKYKD